MVSAHYSLANFIRARMTWSFFAVIGTYMAGAHFLPFQQGAEAWRILQMSLSLVVVIAYAPIGFGSFFVVGRWPEKESLIALGITLAWFSVFCNGAWGTFWRLSGQPSWMVNNDFYQAWVMWNCIAAAIHILAPNILGNDVPKKDRGRLYIAGGVALVLITVVTYERPDLSPYADALKGYMEETPASTGLPADTRLHMVPPGNIQG